MSFLAFEPSAPLSACCFRVSAIGVILCRLCVFMGQCFCQCFLTVSTFFGLTAGVSSRNQLICLFFIAFLFGLNVDCGNTIGNVGWRFRRLFLLCRTCVACGVYALYFAMNLHSFEREYTPARRHFKSGIRRAEQLFPGKRKLRPGKRIYVRGSRPKSLPESRSGL